MLRTKLQKQLNYKKIKGIIYISLYLNNIIHRITVQLFFLKKKKRFRDCKVTQILKV